jgi:3-dehydroquinate synthase
VSVSLPLTLGPSPGGLDAASDEISRPVVIEQPLRLLFTRDVLAPGNATLTRVLTPRDAGIVPRVLVCWDQGLAGVLPDMAARISAWFAAWKDVVRLAAEPVAVPGGEPVKNDRAALERVWAAIDAAHLCRHSYVLVIGGGAVLDMVGFAAATAHRGIPLVRVPTTSLSQADGGIGVKNGVNLFGKKNWLGTFVVPHAVVNDASFLHRLPPRDRRAGLVEAVKVALIRDAAFFEAIESRVDALAAFEPDALEAVVRVSARHHLEHIATGGDPFERGSARPLDFGHWAAHKLEQMTGFAVTHGEAVAIGVALDVVYAVRVGLLDERTADRVLDVLAAIGFELYHAALAVRGADGRRTLLDGLEEFREHLGGRLTIPMIRAIGEQVDVHEMDAAHVDAAIDTLAARYAHG